MDDPNKVQMIPFAAYEAQQERNSHNLRFIVGMLSACIITLVLALMVSLSYDYETTEEVVNEVEQSAESSGSNNFIGGDYNGYSESDSNQNDQNNG